MCLFPWSWNTYGFSAQCHAAGGPSGVPLLADSGWLLYSCGDGFAWGWGLSCNSCPVPPLFSFLCLRCFPFGVLPPYQVGWHVCLQFAGLLLRLVGLLGLQVGFPCCLFLTLEWVYFWLRCLQSLWATKAVSAALCGSSSSSGVCWSISFFWSWGGFWSRVGGSSCDSWFWSLLMLGYTFLTPSPLPLLPSLAVGWSWRLLFLALCLGFVLLASRVGCWLVVFEVFP